MKKLYTTFTFIVLLSMFTMRLGAQLNGAYTINQTIGASPTNFVSFTALATALNASGVSGPVTVNVVTGTGPYNEQVSFNAMTGVSVTNTITINGNGNTITFAGQTAALPHTLQLGGADFMTFTNLTVVNTNATNAQACRLWNGSNKNQFFNCVFTVNLNITVANSAAVSLSGGSTGLTTFGNSGDNNIFSGCTMNSGRYGIILYGNTGTPYNTNNQFINCNVLDFYTYGIYNYYMEATVIRGNTFERLNRTTLSTTYAIYMNYNPGLAITVDGNKFRRLFVGNQAFSGTCYVIFMASQNSYAGNIINIRNNVISNMACNAYLVGYYNPGYPYDNFIHNTISFDDQASTGGTYYGIYSYAPAPSIVKNNLVSINRTGASTKYCLFYPSASPTSNNNILWNNSPSGSNFIGYYNADFATLAAWQGANGGQFDQNSMSADPVFTNPTLFDFTPTVASLNNLGQPLGLLTDVNGLARNLPAPDAGAFEFFNQPCSGTPGTNSILTPTYLICPNGVASVGTANSYTVNGISYQWLSSTNSALGPFTAIPGATLSTYQPTMTVNTFYTASLTCANGGVALQPAAGQVSVAAVTLNTPPYFEGFEGIQGAEKLPNCSWAVSDGTRAHTTNTTTYWMSARTGNKFAYHGLNNNGYGNAQYHWTNGLNMVAGVTYSAAVWFVTPGYAVMADFALEIGTSQTPGGLTTIVSIAQPNSSQYALLSNTFVVPTSGVYYVAIKSTDQYNYDFMAYDDLSITIPCQLAPNTATMNVTGPTAVCAGQAVSLLASGTNSYSWSSGPNTAAYTPTITQNTVYTVVGTNTLSGCTVTIAKPVIANPLPQMSIVGLTSAVCVGQPLTLIGIGANTYSWSSGTSGPMITVTPPASITYTVLGTNVFGCIGSAMMPVTVNPLPVIGVLGNTVACEGERVNLAGTGTAISYTWTSNSSYNVGAQISVAPIGSTSYTVYGTDANGCVGSANRIISVEICSGLNSQNVSANGLVVYPNPNNGIFTIKLVNGANKTVDVTDVTGRVILTGTTTSDKMDMNISQFANGIYYVTVKSNDATEVIKVVKQ